MKNRKAEQLEKSLQEATQGKSMDKSLAPLLATAQIVRALGESPPTPPNHLVHGRRRFLTEAARLRMQKSTKSRNYVWREGNMRVKLAGVLIATLLVFGMVFGVGQAAAASLPGGPLYGLKLAAEQARLELTSDPVAKAELATDLAENRFGEIAQMVAQGAQVDGDTAFEAQQQLSWAYQYMHQVDGEKQLQLKAQFTHMLQHQHQMMASAVDAAPQQTQEPVQALLRSMERVRNEVHTGTGEASGEQIRTNRDEVPQPTGPVGEPGGAGAQAGQDGDGLLLDTTGTGTQAGQDGSVVAPSSGPGPGNEDGPMGPYDGDGPDYGPGPGESQEDSETTPGPFGWFWQLFKKDSQSGSGTSGSGSSSGGSSSGSSSSGSGKN
jgi:uncharacterized membrane protein YgcG